MHKQWLSLQGISEAWAGGGWIRISVRAVARQNAFAMWSSASRAPGLQYINHLQVLPGVDMLTPLLSHWLLWNSKAATDDSFCPSITHCRVLRVPWRDQEGQREEKTRGEGTKKSKIVPWFWISWIQLFGFGFLFCFCLSEKCSFGKGCICLLS